MAAALVPGGLLAVTVRSEVGDDGGRYRAAPGELLDALEPMPGVALGLLTGNVAGGAAVKLAAAGIDRDRFRASAFGCEPVSP